MFAALSLLAVFPIQAPPQVNTDVECEGRMPVVASILSQQLHRKLLASPLFTNEFLIVNEQGASPGDLLNKIAATMDAEWVSKDDALVLTRTPKLEQQVYKAEQEHRIQFVEQLQQDIQARLDISESATSDTVLDGVAARLKTIVTQNRHSYGPDYFQPLLDLDKQSPLSRAAMNLFVDLNPQTLAKSIMRERTVFSLTPNKMQFPLGPGASQILEDAVRDQSRFVNALRRAGYSKRGFYLGGDVGIIWNDAIKFPAKALLIVRRVGGNLPSLSVGLHLADSDGKLTGSGGFHFVKNTYKEMNKPVAIEVGEPDLKLSPIEYELVDRFSNYDDFKHPATAELRKLLLNPEQHDPMEFVFPSAIKAFASYHHTRVVARIPDLGMWAILASKVSHISATRLVNRLCEYSRLLRTEDGNWTIIKPSLSRRDEAMRMPRAEAGAFLRKSNAEGSIDLFDLAHYQAKTEPDVDRTLLHQYLKILMPKNYLGSNLDATTLRIVGNLRDDQIYDAIQPGGLAYGALNQNQQDLVSDYFYNQEDPLRPTKDPDFLQMNTSLKEEPTEMFPNDVPALAGLASKRNL